MSTIAPETQSFLKGGVQKAGPDPFIPSIEFQPKLLSNLLEAAGVLGS